MTVTCTELSLYWLLLTVLLLLIPLRVVDFVSYSGQQRAAILRDLARPQLYSAVRDALDSGAEIHAAARAVMDALWTSMELAVIMWIYNDSIVWYIIILFHLIS